MLSNSVLGGKILAMFDYIKMKMMRPRIAKRRKDLIIYIVNSGATE